MPDLKYSNVDTRPLGVAVRADAGWWEWATSTWSTPFALGMHILPCTADPDIPALQTATLTGKALVPGSFVVEFYKASPTTWTEAGTLNTPENYVVSGPQKGSISWNIGG